MNQHTCLVCRLMDHTLVWRPSYKRVFSPACLGQITSAVQRCESRTQVQVCVIAEQTLPYSYLRKQLPVRERAITLFGKHRVWDTERNSGVLIYVNMVEHAVEIVADRGIASLIPQAQWDAWAQQLNQAFAQNQYQAGLVQTIDTMAPAFAKAMPGPSTGHAINAIDDAPIVL
jgi:uncharacterized membrane protein